MRGSEIDTSDDLFLAARPGARHLQLAGAYRARLAARRGALVAVALFPEFPLGAIVTGISSLTGLLTTLDNILSLC